MGFDNKPVSRREDLVIQELDGEVLIYDLKANKAFCLNETSARVWQACDGSKTMAEIGKDLGDEDLAWLALNDLKKEKLIDYKMPTPSKFEGMSRREVIGKIGMGSMLAIPVIAALAAPTAAQTASACASISCINNGDCSSMGCMTCSTGMCLA